MLLQVLSAPFLIHLNDNRPGKAEEPTPSAWTPIVKVGVLNGVLVVATWSVNQQMEHACLFHSLPETLLSK